MHPKPLTSTKHHNRSHSKERDSEDMPEGSLSGGAAVQRAVGWDGLLTRVFKGRGRKNGRHG